MSTRHDNERDARTDEALQDDNRPRIFQQRRPPSEEEIARDEAHERAYDRFGGTNLGACFFGWLAAWA